MENLALACLWTNRAHSCKLERELFVCWNNEASSPPLPGLCSVKAKNKKIRK